MSSQPGGVITPPDHEPHGGKSVRSPDAREYAGVTKTSSAAAKQKERDARSAHRRREKVVNTLPVEATDRLRDWLNEHFEYPYPSPSDRRMLMKQTGLSDKQINNWFANARFRVWKPAQVGNKSPPSKGPSSKDTSPEGSQKDDSKWPTDILKAWLDKHLDHPYPSEQEKEELAEKAGMEVNELNVWFVNARRRVWQRTGEWSEVGKSDSEKHSEGPSGSHSPRTGEIAKLWATIHDLEYRLQLLTSAVTPLLSQREMSMIGSSLHMHPQGNMPLGVLPPTQVPSSMGTVPMHMAGPSSAPAMYGTGMAMGMHGMGAYPHTQSPGLSPPARPQPQRLGPPRHTS